MSVKYYCDICDARVYTPEKAKSLTFGTMDDDYPYKYNYICDSCAESIRNLLGLLGQGKSTNAEPVSKVT